MWIAPLDDGYSFDLSLGETDVKTSNKTSKHQKEEARALIEVFLIRALTDQSGAAFCSASAKQSGHEPLPSERR
jgi:hypothetical protein